VVEAAPRVTAFDGREIAPGDRITWTIAASCGSCFYCRRGLGQKCETLLKYGHAEIADHWTFNGGLGDYCHLKEGTSIHRVPKELPDEVVCPVNCATATVSAGFRKCERIEGRTVLVQGAGMLGITACAMARALGAEKVIVYDSVRRRIERALDFGATEIIHASPDDELSERVLELSQGYGVDIAFELTGAKRSAELGLEVLRTGGEAVWIGTTHPTDPVPVYPEKVVRRMLAVRGVHNYTPDDLEFAVRFLEENHSRFPFSELVEKTFPLSEVNQAIENAISSKAFRIAVKP